MDYQLLLHFVTNVIFVSALGWYLITNFQWYDYKIERVVLKHHKLWWHIIYFIIPFITYYGAYRFFWIFLFFAILPALFMWHKKLDKKLVLTGRVKRFLGLLITLTLFQDYICTLKEACEMYGVFMPLLLTYIGSTLIEKYLFLAYKKEASKKLERMKHLKIVAITGSYGKTSTKNFLTQMLKKRYKVYATPRSVNTIGGIIRDINENLSEDTEIYICEAGARQRGDIYTIATFLHPHIVVVAKVGPQHLEYFKSIDVIKRTKLELIQSKLLEHAFVHNSVTDEPHEKVRFFGEDIHNVKANLDATSFDLELDGEMLHLQTPVLGAFQSINITAAIHVALALSLNKEEIVELVGKLQPIQHRLEKIEAGGKIILDDGYNGNLDGMLEAIRLCSLHKGRKVVVTPGLVESDESLNLELIEAINGVFDYAIITGSLNMALFAKELTIEHTLLKNKEKLTSLLATKTQAGDIILFANDAPNFI